MAINVLIYTLKAHVLSPRPQEFDITGLYSRTRGALYNRGLRGDQLDDGAQDVMLAVLQTPPDYILRSFRNYTFGIIKHVACAIVMRQARERWQNPSLELALHAASKGHRADEILIREESLRMADKVFRSLPAGDRELLTRFYLQEQGVTQICVEMGLNPKQFRNRKHRARLMLAERYAGMAG